MKRPAVNGQLIIVSAPSGAGKTSLIKSLLDKTPGLTLSVSHTTRPRRPGEIEGEHYFFIDSVTFAQMVAAGEFLEHAVVFGNCYGTARASVFNTLAAGFDVILELDWQGARRIRKLFPATISVFIVPPSTAVLRERLEGRQQDDAAIIERRMAAAAAEMAHQSEYDYVVLNDSFDHALADLSAIMRAARLRVQH